MANGILDAEDFCKSRQFNARLTNFREQCGLTHAELAGAMGITKAEYYDIEEGYDVATQTSLLQLFKLASALRIRPSELFCPSVEANASSAILAFGDKLKNDPSESIAINRKVDYRVFQNPDVLRDISEWNLDCLIQVSIFLQANWQQELDTIYHALKRNAMW